MSHADQNKSLSRVAENFDNLPTSLPALEEKDDRYPGTFYQKPGIPLPGKTTWYMVK